jgi:hypothetical protein
MCSIHACSSVVMTHSVLKEEILIKCSFDLIASILLYIYLFRSQDVLDTRLFFCGDDALCLERRILDQMLIQFNGIYRILLAL